MVTRVAASRQQRMAVQQENPEAKLKRAFRDILQCQTGNYLFEELYAAAYKITLQHEFHAFAKEIDNVLRSHMGTHVQPKLSKASDSKRTLQLTLELFDKACVAFRLLSTLFLYENKSFEVNNLSVASFRDCCVLINNNAVGERLQEAMMDMVIRKRLGEVVEADYCKAACNMLLTFGEPLPDARFYYKKFFETRFLKLSQEFYCCEAQRLLKTKSLQMFVDGVNQRMEEEKELARSLVHESTHAVLTTHMKRILVHDCMQFLEDESGAENAGEGLGFAIDHADMKLLIRLRDLLNLASADGVTQLKNAFVTAFVKRATLIVHAEDKLELASKLIKLYYNFAKGNDAFSAKLFEGSADFVQNLQTHCANVLESDKSKCSEALALYADRMLQKSNNKPYDETKAELAKVFDFFRLLPEKDTFEGFYKIKLAYRLLKKTSFSDDMEKEALGLLRSVCSIDYMRKLEAMFRDLDISRDINAEHATAQREKGGTSRQQQQKAVDIHVDVLQLGIWPTKGFQEPQLSGAVQTALDHFKEFYLKRFPHRKLTVASAFGTAEISASFYGPVVGLSNNDASSKAIPRTYILAVNTVQMLILSLFDAECQPASSSRKDIVARKAALESAESCKRNLQSLFDAECQPKLAFKDIVARTALDAELCKRNLQSLTDKRQRILNKSPANTEIHDDDVFCVNDGFYSPSRKVKIAVAVPKAARVADDTKVREQIFEDRKPVIDAALVRVMKMNRTLPFQTLIGECVKLVKERFTPDVLTIKLRIENLIEREYFVRDDADRSKLHYVA